MLPASTSQKRNMVYNALLRVHMNKQRRCFHYEGWRVGMLPWRVMMVYHNCLPTNLRKGCYIVGKTTAARLLPTHRYLLEGRIPGWLGGRPSGQFDEPRNCTFPLLGHLP